MPRQNNYELLKETYAIVSRVEDKLDRLEIRVSTLELWKAELMGRVTIIVGFISLAFTMVWDYLRKKINL